MTAHDGPHESPVTLGHLLYADGRRAFVTEDDWTRLVQATAAGDQLALRALYERSHRLVFTLAVRVTGSRDSAEEVTLDVFHEVWRRSSRYDSKDGSVLGWIMNLARSRAIDRLRFEQRKKRVPPSVDGHEQPRFEQPGPADALDARQQRMLMREALAALTQDERTAVQMAFFSDLTYSETAARLGQPLGTVKTRIRSALAKLRQALLDQGVRP
jgi:RNA polymerase sigma-70 factor, ECF subfamily